MYDKANDKMDRDKWEHQRLQFQRLVRSLVNLLNEWRESAITSYEECTVIMSTMLTANGRANEDKAVHDAFNRMRYFFTSLEEACLNEASELIDLGRSAIVEDDKAREAINGKGIEDCVDDTTEYGGNTPAGGGEDVDPR